MAPEQRMGDDHDFDRLLAQAQWPEPRADQIARLRERWEAIGRRRRKRQAYGACMLSLAVLLTAGLWAWSDRGVSPLAKLATRREPPTLSDVSEAHGKRSHNPQQTRFTDGTTARPELTEESNVSRDPNVYERVVLHGVWGNRSRPRAVADQRASGQELLEELIAALASDAHADVGARLATIAGARHERALWNIIPRATPARRLGAVRLLARIATPRSLSILADLTNDPATHAAAIEGLGGLVSAQDLAQMATVEPDAPLRRHLLSTLLLRRTDEAVGLYLEFVNNPRSRSEVLDIPAGMKNPPVDVLLTFLSRPQPSVRLAAAQVLGRLPQPEIAARLSESVYDVIGRQEALVALLLSPVPEAANVLREARGNLYLVAAVQAAELQLQSLAISERR
jgi:hypothetical protein